VGLVAATWGALYDAGRWVALFIVKPVHLDFRIFYVAAEAGLRYGWSRIYDVDTLRSLSSSFPVDERYINSAATYIHPPLLAWLVALIVDDQGRRHHELFLQALM
jgi:hypothetical protein